MKKALNLFILPLLAGCTICAALHTLIPFSGLVGADQLNEQGTHFIFGLLGFLFGFLPCFIYGLACSTLADMRPASCVAPAPLVEQDINIYVGKTFTSIGANCAFRVKAIKIPALLEYHNELLADYM